MCSLCYCVKYFSRHLKIQRSLKLVLQVQKRLHIGGLYSIFNWSLILFEVFQGCFVVIIIKIVYFQKISLPPPQEGFFLRPPTPLEIPIKVLLWSKNSLLFFLQILKACFFDTSLAKSYASNFIQRLFSLSASLRFYDLPLLTFKTDWLDFRGLDRG